MPDGLYTIALAARYGRQPVWGPDGLLEAPWAEVSDFVDAVMAIASMETRIDGQEDS